METLKTFGDAYSLASWIQRRMATTYDFSASEPTIRKLVEDRQNVIQVVYHGGTFSWLLAQAVAVLEYTRLGGADRTPFGVFHRLFFSIPGISWITKALVNAEPVNDFDHLVEILKTGRYTDIGIYPEGDNSFYSDGRTVQPFKSSRFIELSLRTGFSLVLTVYSGTEHHTLQIEMPQLILNAFGRLPFYSRKRLSEIGALVIPVIRKAPLSRFSTMIYQPELRLADLPDERTERKALLDAEGRKVRQTMQTMLDQVYAIDDSTAAANPFRRDRRERSVTSRESW